MTSLITLIPGTGSNWTPAKLSSQPKLWLDARQSSLFTTNGSGNAAAFTSRSPGTVTGTAANDAAAPSFDTGINGIRSLKFDGTANRLVTSSFLGAGYNTAFTMFSVTRRFNGTFKEWLCNQVLVFTIGSGTVCRLNTSGLSDADIRHDLSGANISTPGPYTTPEIFAFRYNGTTKSLWKDGFKKDEAATGNLGLSGAFTIGDLSSGAALWTGWLGELLVCNAALSDADVLLVHKYLASGWNARAPVLAVDGNSLSVYEAGNIAGSGSWPGRFAAANPTWNVVNCAVVGQTTANMQSDQTQVSGLHSSLRQKSVCVMWEGTNSLAGGAAAATVITQLKAYGAAAKAAGQYVIIGTVIDRQNAGLPGSFQTDRATVNAEINNVANIGVSWDAVYDIAGDSRFSDATNTTYFNSDKVHLTATGYALAYQGFESLILAAPVSSSY